MKTEKKIGWNKEIKSNQKINDNLLKIFTNEKRGKYLTINWHWIRLRIELHCIKIEFLTAFISNNKKNCIIALCFLSLSFRLNHDRCLVLPVQDIFSTWILNAYFCQSVLQHFRWSTRKIAWQITNRYKLDSKWRNYSLSIPPSVLI